MTKFEDENSAPPETPAPPQTAPVQTLSWRTGLIGVIVLLMLGVMFLWARTNRQASSDSRQMPRAEIVQPAPANPSQTLTLTWTVVTAGPSPFNPGTWVARIELKAMGGNDEYIFWVNGQRLPEASNDQFTVESQGCEPVSQFVGVTSDGQSIRQELLIHPPQSSSCSR